MLHTVNASPFERTALTCCLAHAVNGDAVVLIEDAVYAVVKGSTASAEIVAMTEGVDLYVLGPDLAARGINRAKLIAGITEIDYAGFVDLVVAHTSSQAWL